MQFVNCLRHGPKQRELRGQKMARWTKQLAAPNKCWPCQHRQKGTCMKKSSAIERTSALVLAPPTGRVTVLCISPLDEDHLSFHAIIGHSKWMLFDASDLASALALLQQHEIAVLLCERDLTQGTWTDVLEHIQALPNTPSLIVTSRLADDRLWAEALNLGAWDVLAKPFDRTEVIRSVKSAWQHWHDQIHMRATTVKMMAAS